MAIETPRRIPQLYLSQWSVGILAALSDSLSISLKDLVAEIALMSFVPVKDAEVMQALASASARRAKLQVAVSEETKTRLAALSDEGTAAAGLEAVVRGLVVPSSPPHRSLEIALRQRIGDDPIYDLREAAAGSAPEVVDTYKLWLSSKAVRNLKTLVLQMDNWKNPRRNFSGVLDYLAADGISFRVGGELYPWPRHPRFAAVHPKIALRYATVALAEGMALPANRRDGPLFGHAVEAIGQGAMLVVRGEEVFNAGRGPRLEEPQP